jgi:RNA polymerase-binding transcription factor DksA
LADDCDLAGDRIEIEMGRIMSAFHPATGESLSDCAECGNEIPQARQKAVKGCRLCIDCAAVAERKGVPRRG